ncbi:hypothetical protein ATER59S_01740 [Aquamicrobium terrae]
MTRFWRYIAAALGLAVVLAGVAAAIHLAAPGRQGSDFSRSKATVAGLFVVTIGPEGGAVRLGESQAWTLRLSTPQGAPVENAAIDVSGGMPQHAHGLPTSPQVTEYLGDGRYRIEGVKFSMHGWWQLRVGVSAAAGSDTVVFNIAL